MIIEAGEEEIKQFQEAYKLMHEHSNKETNWDHLKTLSADKFAEVFWLILSTSQGWTHSQVWLKSWLNEEYDPKKSYYIFGYTSPYRFDEVYQ